MLQQIVDPNLAKVKSMLLGLQISAVATTRLAGPGSVRLSKILVTVKFEAVDEPKHIHTSWSLMMLKTTVLMLALSVCLAATNLLHAVDVTGTYLEARTCQVYTGPCFANAEVGLTGNDAIMAWNIERGAQGDVDLSGLNVIVVVNATGTLGFKGIDDPKQVKSVIFVDQRANQPQREALVDFAKKHSGRAGESVVRVDASPIKMSLDKFELDGRLEAGKAVKLVTRKAKPGDCICSNESAYYPPLAKVEHFAAGVALEGHFKGRGLNSRWSIPDSRSAYMATFAYEDERE